MTPRWRSLVGLLSIFGPGICLWNGHSVQRARALRSCRIVTLSTLVGLRIDEARCHRERDGGIGVRFRIPPRSPSIACCGRAPLNLGNFSLN
ncbi:hypothetical protein DFH06DRAFT_1205090 [Mycena polygramma]|nr:hypothetical protein DFH06DRAFT_1205090 [Mycena polygramma]